MSLKVVMAEGVAPPDPRQVTLVEVVARFAGMDDQAAEAVAQVAIMLLARTAIVRGQSVDEVLETFRHSVAHNMAIQRAQAARPDGRAQ